MLATVRASLPTVLACVATAATALVSTAGPAAAHDGATADSDRAAKRASYLAGTSIPVVTSPNVRLVTSVPETDAIAGVFAKSAPYFYISSLDSISVVDVSDPLKPKLTGTLPNLVFENEAINYGEQKKDGVVSRFVLVGVDLVEYSPGDPDHVGRSNEVMVVDVTDPANPRIRSRAKTTTNTHTVSCIRETDCRYAYTAGRAGKFSIVDLTDLDNPREVKVLESAAGKPNEVFTRGAGHKWNFDNAGYGFHTGSGGTAVFDVSDPLNPVPVEGTNELGTDNRPESETTGWNNFIHHNADRPNASKFVPGAAPSVANGNVVFVTEEDYFNDGEELACDQAGTFQSWYLPTLDGEAYRAANPTLEPDKGSMSPLDKINPVKIGDGLSAPVGGFCSAHWFDYHQSGIVAAGFYQQGLRFIDTRNPSDLKAYGHFTTGVSEVWDAYWVPERNNNGVATGRKTNIVYSVDFVRGIDVLTVDLPGTTTDGELLPVAASGAGIGTGSAGVLALLVLTTAGVALLRRRVPVAR